MLFEKATRQKLRFETNRGYATVEDLWDMSLNDLNTLAKSCSRVVKSAAEEDFLSDASEVNAEDQLAFDVVLHVLNVKKDELKDRKEALARRAQRDRLQEILADKQDASLKELSVEELEQKLKEVS